MKSKLTFLLCLLTHCCLSQQKTAGLPAWNASSVMRIDYNSKQVLNTCPVSNEGVISIDDLPETLLVAIPASGWETISIQMNEGKEAFQVAANCKDKDCEPFMVTDLENGVLKLSFYKGQLTKIGNRSISPRTVKAKKPFIKIGSVSTTGKAEIKTASVLQTGADQSPIGEITAEQINNNLKCLLCSLTLPSLPCCTDQAPAAIAEPKGQKGYKKPVAPFMYSNTVDVVTGKENWFLVDLQGNQKPVDLKDVHPIANSTMEIVVKGIDTVTYEMSLNGESFFLDGEKDFKQILGSDKADSGKKDSGAIAIDSTKQPGKQGEQTSPETNWKAKLLALDKVLESFNAKYSSIDFVRADYAADLLQLKQNIKCCFGTSLGSSESLTNFLRLYTKLNIDSAFFKEIDLVIDDVAKEYAATLSKTSNRKIVALIKQVPDEDRVTLTLKAANNATPLRSYSFWVKGGYKIDFSSGIFVSGIQNPDFILQKFNFAYGESRDSVLVRSGQPVDTTIYTGKVLTTSGNFITENRNKVSYMAGFFAHLYKRSGHAVNWGGGLGFSLNTNGQPYILAGLSGMLHTASARRIAVIVGVIGGNQKTLTASAENYRIKQDYTNHDNNAVIYGNIHQVPKFYDTGNNLSVDVYQRFRFSWFAGLSFHFGSFSLK